MNEADQIKKLKEEIAILKQQKKILLDALDIASMAEGIIGALKDQGPEEAIKRAQLISLSALNAMAESSKLEKPFFE